MRPIRAQDLLGVALVVAVLAHLLVRLTYDTLPALPLFGGITLGVLGIAEAVAGSRLRARIARRPGTTPVPPLLAARAVLVARASAVAAAAMAGAWAGLLVHVVPRSADVAAAAGDAAAGWIGLACALVLIGGALWLQHCCRVPTDHGPSTTD